MDERTWTIYVDHGRMMVDTVDEGPNPAGAVGSGWQPGYTRQEAETAVARYEAAGYLRGHERAARF